MRACGAARPVSREPRATCGTDHLSVVADKRLRIFLVGSKDGMDACRLERAGVAESTPNDFVVHGVSCGG